MSRHVAVVGAGVVGLCAAHYLRRDGNEVTVVDRGLRGGDKCSLGNSGIVVPSHSVPLAAPGMVSAGMKMLTKRDGPFRIKPSLDPGLARWCLLFARHCTEEHVSRCAPVLLKMHLESRRLIEEMAREMGNPFGLETRGLVVLCRTEEALDEERAQAARGSKLGLQTEALDPGRCAEAVGTEVRASGGVLYRDDAHLAPHHLVQSLQERLEAGGVRFLWESEARLAMNDGKAHLETSQGAVGADHFVIAAGASSEKFASALGLYMPVQPGKGMSVDVQGGGSPHTPMLLKEARVAVTPMAGAVRFGGTMELGEWDTTPDQRRAKGMAQSVPEYLPGFTTDQLSSQSVWAGLRPCSPDGMPYIGRSRHAANVVFATGHGMMGVSLGAVTGRLVADSVAGRDPSEALLSPDRFD